MLDRTADEYQPLSHVFHQEPPDFFDQHVEDVSVTIGDATYCGTVENAVSSFKGIRYATAGRWQAPTLFHAKGDIQAKQFGKSCPQHPYTQKDMSEDCLFLNIWAPSKANDVPVLFFIHGNEVQSGSGSSPIYDGYHFAKSHNTIVVTFNYRFGVLGFFHREGVNGNFGIQDQCLALKWVYENIREFGGDPENITIAGEGAGAMSVAIQLGLQQMQPYFSKAIMESPYLGVFYKDHQTAQMMSVMVEDMGGQENTPVSQLLEIEEAFLSSFLIGGLDLLFGFTPYLDGELVTHQPLYTETDKPLIVGNNAGEAAFFASSFSELINSYTYVGFLRAVFGRKLADKIMMITKYNTSHQKALSALSHVINDALFFGGTDYFLNQSSSLKNYRYLFDYVGSYEAEGLKGEACHGAELNFVFDNPPEDTCFSRQDEKMARLTGVFWAHFLCDGDPGCAEGVNWSPYTECGQLNLTAPLMNTSLYHEARHFSFWKRELYDTGLSEVVFEKLLNKCSIRSNAQ